MDDALKTRNIKYILNVETQLFFAPLFKFLATLLGNRPPTSLGHQGGRKVFWEGDKFFKRCPIVSKYVQHIFPGGRKFFYGALPPLVTALLGSPGKSGVAHPHLVASLTQQFVIKFKLHSCLHSFPFKSVGAGKRSLVSTIETKTSVIKYILTFISVSCIWQLHHSQYRLKKSSPSKYIQLKFLLKRDEKLGRLTSSLYICHTKAMTAVVDCGTRCLY